jgi:hypothetical protein
LRVCAMNDTQPANNKSLRFESWCWTKDCQGTSNHRHVGCNSNAYVANLESNHIVIYEVQNSMHVAAASIGQLSIEKKQRLGLQHCENTVAGLEHRKLKTPGSRLLQYRDNHRLPVAPTSSTQVQGRTTNSERSICGHNKQESGAAAHVTEHVPCPFPRGLEAAECAQHVHVESVPLLERKVVATFRAPGRVCTLCCRGASVCVGCDDGQVITESPWFDHSILYI